MPKAVVSSEFFRHDLKTLPEGYVMLRAMAYGDTLERDGMALKMSTQMNAMNRKQRRSKQASAIDFKLGNSEVTLYDFQKCTGEHNLEDEQGNLLNLHSSQGLNMLDPKIGHEIDDKIKELNGFDLDEDVEEFEGK